MVRKLLLLGLIFSLLLVACPEPRQRSSPQQGAPAGSIGGTLVIGASSELDNFNTVTSTTTIASTIQGLMFLPLFKTDENFKLHASDYKPCLVNTWRFSEDFLELTLFLRDDVKWSDGIPVTAEDVYFTYKMLVDPTVITNSRSYMDFVSECIVKGDYEITFRFKEVYSSEMEDINIITPMPRHVFGNISGEEFNVHAFNENPSVVNGPYKLANWDRQQVLELVVNETYSFPRANLDRVVFRIIPDVTARLTNLKTGDVDLIQQISPDQVDDLEKNYPHIDVKNYSGMSIDFIRWLNTHPLFSDRRVRRALTMGINRKQIVDALLFGYGTVCNSPIHPQHKDFYNPNLVTLPYDPDGALKILNDLGWRDTDNDGILDKNGKKFEFHLKTNLGNQRRMDAITMIQADLARIGVAVIPQQVEFTVLVEQMQNRDYEAALSGMRMGTTFNPTDVWHSKSIASGYNWVNYSNDRVDALIEKGRRTLDKTKARDVWFEFQQEVYNDQPYTFLYLLDNLDGIDRKFQGVKTSPAGIFFNVPEWWLEETP